MAPPGPDGPRPVDGDLVGQRAAWDGADALVAGLMCSRVAIPGFVFGSFVIGHNSVGLVPLFVAWACTAWTLETRTSEAEAGLAERTR